MNREDARQEIRRQWRTIIATMTAPATRRVNGETSWICPLCGHGTHGDGLTRNPSSKDGNGLKCFGCGFAGDIIDLYQQQTGADFPTAVSILAAEINLTLDPHQKTAEPAQEATGGRRSDFSGREYKSIPPEKNGPQGGATEAVSDYTAYYQECRQRITDPAAAATCSGGGSALIQLRPIG